MTACCTISAVQPKTYFAMRLGLLAALRDHPNIEVVISSDWRKDVGSVAELAENFDFDVRHQFVGLT